MVNPWYEGALAVEIDSLTLFDSGLLFDAADTIPLDGDPCWLRLTPGMEKGSIMF